MLKKVIGPALVTLVMMSLVHLPSNAAEETCPKEAPKASRQAWPPPPVRGEFDLIHFGEGHWNEGQGPKTMPILVQDLVRFRPDLVTFSSDMADIGTVDRLACFRSIMGPLERAGITWFNSPGNHDRVAAAGPGGVMSGSIAVWRDVFAGMPAPWGDAAPTSSGFRVPQQKPDDGRGASTHYYFDYGRRAPVVRLIFLDNSQQSLTTSDLDQYPAVGPAEHDLSQLGFLERAAQEAEDEGLLTFVTMHQPTQDPRDPSGAHPISLNHTMGKGLSPDNQLFDTIASRTGVDSVLLGHIQGNAIYEVGQTRYFIDGGGGGSPYSNGKVGTDTGYYYGFRILRVSPSADSIGYRTYFVPLVDHIEIRGPSEAEVGELVDLDATAVQPFDPDLPPRFGGAPNEAIRVELRPVAPGPFRDAVPDIAYVWETSNPAILRPVGSRGAQDPAFDPKTMSTTGRFEAVRAGTATITIKVGTHVEKLRVTVEG